MCFPSRPRPRPPLSRSALGSCGRGSFPAGAGKHFNSCPPSVDGSKSADAGFVIVLTDYPRSPRLIRCQRGSCPAQAWTIIFNFWVCRGERNLFWFMSVRILQEDPAPARGDADLHSCSALAGKRTWLLAFVELTRTRRRRLRIGFSFGLSKDTPVPPKPVCTRLVRNRRGPARLGYD